MIHLAVEFYMMCTVSAMHPTIFVNEDGECVAVCSSEQEFPYSCYDERGESVTDCFDDNGRQMLCDAYFVEITPDDYEIIKQ